MPTVSSNMGLFGCPHQGWPTPVHANSWCLVACSGLPACPCGCKNSPSARPGRNGRFPLHCSAWLDRCTPLHPRLHPRVQLAELRGMGSPLLPQNRSLPSSLLPLAKKLGFTLGFGGGAALLSSSLRPRAAALSLAVAEAAAAANPSPFRGKERTARRAEGGERRRDL